MDNNLGAYIGNKIKHYRKLNKMTQDELANKLNLGKGTISNYESGYRTPQQNRLFELSEALGISINDLFPPTTENKSIVDKIIDISNQLESDRQEKVYNFADSQLEKQNKIININKYSKDDNEDDLIEETMEGYLSAGTGEFLAEDIKEPIMINRSLLPEQHYDMILQVNGDSMEPMFEDHEYVFIRTTEEIRNGQIGVFVIDGESLLKKVYINDDHLRLVSLNKKYDDLIFDSLNDIHLIGTVVM